MVKVHALLKMNKMQRKLKIIGYNREGEGRGEPHRLFWNDSHAEKWGKIHSGSVSQGVWSKSHWQK